MSAQAFHFRFGNKPSFAMGHTSGTVALSIAFVGDHRTTLAMSPADARAMATALEAAATHAENALATGLGESAVTS